MEVELSPRVEKGWITMLQETFHDRRLMLNEMLRRGVTVSDLGTLKRGEMVYLLEKDVATVRELSDYTGKTVNQIQHICRREESILYKGRSKMSTGRKSVFGRLKFPVRYFIRMEEYPDFVDWREKNLDYVSMRTGYRMLGKKSLNKLIREGGIKLSTPITEGRESTGISKSSLLNQLNIEVTRLNGCIEELTTYNDSDFDDSDVGEVSATRSARSTKVKIQLSAPLGAPS